MTVPSMRILVPTSERKNRGGTLGCRFHEVQSDRNHNRFVSLTRPRRIAIQALVESVNGHGHAEQVLRRSGARLETAQSINLQISCSSVMPAIERESGPLFAALDHKSLDPKSRALFERSALLFCPLMGVLAPSDQVPDYRCPVGAQIPGWGSLHRFWKPALKPVLDRACRGRHVISLLPGRLSALWAPSPGVASYTTVQFLQKSVSGRVRPEHAGHGGLSGELIRFLVSQGGRAESLRKFKSSQGHVYSEASSTEEGGRRNIVFTRAKATP